MTSSYCHIKRASESVNCFDGDEFLRTRTHLSPRFRAFASKSKSRSTEFDPLELKKGFSIVRRTEIAHAHHLVALGRGWVSQKITCEWSPASVICRYGVRRCRHVHHLRHFRSANIPTPPLTCRIPRAMPSPTHH